MTDLTVNVDYLSMLPLYACIFTGILLACVALPVQGKLMDIGEQSASPVLRVGLGTRFGSAAVILAGGFALLLGEVFTLVPLTGGFA